MESLINHFDCDFSTGSRPNTRRDWMKQTCWWALREGHPPAPTLVRDPAAEFLHSKPCQCLQELPRINGHTATRFTLIWPMSLGVSVTRAPGALRDLRLCPAALTAAPLGAFPPGFRSRTLLFQSQQRRSLSEKGPDFALLSPAHSSSPEWFWARSKCLNEWTPN